MPNLTTDGHPDLIWQEDATGKVAVWYMGGAQGSDCQAFGWLHSVGAGGWKVVGATDLAGDGQLDIVWQEDTTGRVAADPRHCSLFFR